MDSQTLHSSPTTRAQATLEGSGSKNASSSAPRNDVNPNNIPPAPSRKHRRTGKSTRENTVEIRSPNGFMDLPIEIFSQVTRYLLPADILHLARVNKVLRNLLMRRSSAHLWRGAVRNLPGLPPCPPHLCEPQYFSLLYSTSCMECGTRIARQVDPDLYVLLCVHCQPNVLVHYQDVHEYFRPLLPWSMDIVPASNRNMKCGLYALAVDVQRLQVESGGREHKAWQRRFSVKLKDDVWYCQKEEAQQMRKKASEKLSQFLLGRKKKKERDIEEKKEAFRNSVEMRLVAMGWEPSDVELPWSRVKEWRPLLEQARVLNNRTWDKLYPKLLPLLKENREERLTWNQERRSVARREEFKLIWARTGRKCPAYIAHGPTTSTLNKFLPPADEAMEWPCIKQILDTDTTANEIKRLISQRRPKILQAMHDWQKGIERSLAECLRQDKAVHRYPEIPPTVLSKHPLFPDLALLLRADSIFMYSEPGCHEPRFFPRVLDGPIVGLKDNLLSASWDPRFVRSHSVARQFAKAFLKRLGCPDMPYLPMKCLGERFVCGRCHDELPNMPPMSWEGIIMHYVERQNMWFRHQGHIEEWRSKGTTINNVHDVNHQSDKPLIRLISVEEASGCAFKSAAAQAMVIPTSGYKCVVCPDGYNGPFEPEGIMAHHQNVHGSLPKPNLGHYYS